MNSTGPVLDIAKKSYSSIRNGGLSLVKADIGYGLLGHSESSIKKMYRLKNRPLSNPCIAAGNIQTLKDVCVFKHQKILDWISEIEKISTLAVVNPINPDSLFFSSLSKFVKQQVIINDTIAVFLNSGEYINAMIKFANKENFLLLGSSGNLSSHGNNYSFDEVPKTIIDHLDYFYDAGRCKYENEDRLATTILNFNDFTIRRKGVNAELIIQSYNQFALKNELPILI